MVTCNYVKLLIEKGVIEWLGTTMTAPPSRPRSGGIMTITGDGVLVAIQVNIFSTTSPCTSVRR
jgi:hypothetical protein